MECYTKSELCDNKNQVRINKFENNFSCSIKEANKSDSYESIDLIEKSSEWMYELKSYNCQTFNWQTS